MIHRIFSAELCFVQCGRSTKSMPLDVCDCALTLLYKSADYLPPPSLSDPDMEENQSRHDDQCWKCDLSTSPLVRQQFNLDTICHICGVLPCQTPKYSQYGGDACPLALPTAQLAVLLCGRICHLECVYHGQLSATVVIGKGDNLDQYRQFLEDDGMNGKGDNSDQCRRCFDDVGMNAQSAMFGVGYGMPLVDGCRYLDLCYDDEVLVTRVGIKQGELGWLFGSRLQKSDLEYHGQASNVSGEADCGWFPLCLIAASYPRSAQLKNVLCRCAVCDHFGVRNFAVRISLHDLEVAGAVCSFS